MTGVLLGEKQLFEKFWKGTFEAVAMPRPESIIIASITARRAVTKLETAVSLAPKDEEEKVKTKDTVTKKHEKNGHTKRRGSKRHSHRRARSVSLDAELSPRPVPRTKKKKKKSQRKRRRHRSPSCSPSPVRKKKKKSSKKRKRHRSASRKGRHSGSSPRRKRKEEKKHKKRSKSHSHRHRRRKAEIRSSSCMENRYEDCEKSGFQDGGHSSAVHGGDACRSAIKLTNKISSKCCCHFSESTVSPSRHGVKGLNKMMIVQDSISNKGKGQADYDSGNDTSSPLSSKTGITRSKVTRIGKFSCQDLTCPEKLRLADGDNASDSGNSLTSYDSLGKPVLRENTLHSSVFNKFKGEETGRHADLEKTQPLGLATDRNRSPSYDRYQDRTRSRSRSISSQSRYSGRYSRSRSLSSGRRSYSRSSSYSLDSRRDSLSSASSCRSLNYSRCTPDRFRERKRDCSSCKSRKHSRRRPCSPMRKRRRDSPSHLEARRITSARKRPIPYHRPSPSVSSRSSSLLSWRLFSLGRSRSRSRSRSHTSSSYRSYSRSSSWNSVYSRRSRSRSRSYESIASYSRARR
ncbi:serine/arginine repetitive matrix protein 4 [Pimephales promelas]|uniref:serine/arginine repetitive matrix protein 4 n=1 Tax=Pimephales promelas TaxID=90988 RepID=UPI001955EE71|nr:serine/arginine repetitive matrix protein 4 [Pimephales promelas]KAG1958061.1 serine/arginine repetitive matrix protein [Pimephales promelas]